MQAVRLGEFRSVEAIEPTTVTIYPDRIVLENGSSQSARIVPVSDLARVKVRTIFGISSLLLKTKEGRSVVADLLKPDDARAAQSLVEDLIEGTAAPSEAVA